MIYYSKNRVEKKQRGSAFGTAPIMATRQDSINVRDRSREVKADYIKNGYKENPAITFAGNNLDKNYRDIQDKFKNQRERTTVIAGNSRFPTWLDPSYYRKVIDENKFEQREGNSKILNLNARAPLYDKRIQPTSFLNLINEDGGLYDGDMVGIPYYGDMKISGEDGTGKNPVVARQPVPVKDTITPTTTRSVAGSTTPAVTTPATTVRSASRPSYRQAAPVVERDNTRVGTSFTTIDPRTIQLAKTATLPAKLSFLQRYAANKDYASR